MPAEIYEEKVSDPSSKMQAPQEYEIKDEEYSMSKEPITAAPTDAEWENHARWAVGPVGTRRQLWVESEAQAAHRERTGRADPWPSVDDYTEANSHIPLS